MHDTDLNSDNDKTTTLTKTTKLHVMITKFEQLLILQSEVCDLTPESDGGV